MGLLCVTCDLDELGCYHDIHGLNPPENQVAGVVYERAVSRIAEWVDQLGVKATFFVVGRDLEQPSKGSDRLKALAREGHEIGNHSMTHRYDLTRLGQEGRTAEIDRGAEIIQRTLGYPPKGFRAPGYTIDTDITGLLIERNYTYDSSVFPCPLYYTTKAAMIGYKSVQGKPSKSIIDNPRILGAPTRPYRLGSEVWSTGQGLVELPITVVSKARLPMLGTTLALMGKLPASLLARAAAGLPFVNLELHGIDFIDADGDGIGYLTEHQPELNVSYINRRAIFERVVAVLLNAGMESVTLLEAATRLFID